MRDYEKLASHVALLIVVISLVINVLSKHIFSENILPLGTELLIAVVVGAASFLIMEWLPQLLIREKTLCGLYLIVYNDMKTPLCSIMNIDYSNEHIRYSIDVYDCFLEGSQWFSVEGQYPQSLDNIYYDKQPTGVHIISNDESKKSCIFIRFTSKTIRGNVVRYGGCKPFNKPLGGQIYRLTNADLCSVFNPGYNNDNFCNMLVSDLILCKGQNRAKCKKKTKNVLSWVRNDPNRYISIPKILYWDYVEKQPSAGVPLTRRHAVKNNRSGSNVANVGKPIKEIREKSTVFADTSDGKTDCTKSC